MQTGHPHFEWRPARVIVLFFVHLLRHRPAVRIEILPAHQQPSAGSLAKNTRPKPRDCLHEHSIEIAAFVDWTCPSSLGKLSTATWYDKFEGIAHRLGLPTLGLPLHSPVQRTSIPIRCRALGSRLIMDRLKHFRELDLQDELQCKSGL